MESFQTNCFPFPFALPARRKAADNPTAELLLTHFWFYFSPVSIHLSPPSHRENEKQSQGSMEADGSSRLEDEECQ